MLGITALLAVGVLSLEGRLGPRLLESTRASDRELVRVPQVTGARAACSWALERFSSGPKLYAVATSGRDVWAVGIDASRRPAVLRRRGGTWQRVPLPSRDKGQLNDVAVTSSGEVWMVGDSFVDFSVRPLVLRFDGRRLVAVAAPDRHGLATLVAIAAGPGVRGRAGIWVGGGDFAAGVFDPFVILRASSRGWENLPGGRISEGLIEAIAATSATEAWAVGAQGGADSIVTFDSLVLRWDGRRWRPMNIPAERINDPDGEPVDALSGVAARGRKQAWAVGYDQVGGVALHWQGRSWERSPIAKPSPRELTGVASSASAAWAVGHRDSGQGQRPVLLRWSGGRWLRAAQPASGLRAALEGVAVSDTQGQAWAVGGYGDYEDGQMKTLILHYRCR